MAIVFPSEEVARRWDGALQARLRRAPLEAFLRSRSLIPAPAGVDQDSENLARATVILVEAGVSLFCADRVEELGFRHRAVLVHIVCLVSRAFAELISQPTAWRIAALVSTARLLSPWIGLNAAAIASADAAREFQKEFSKTSSSLDRRIIEGACAALNRGGEEAMAKVAASIAARLKLADSAGSFCAAEDLRELHSGS